MCAPPNTDTARTSTGMGVYIKVKAACMLHDTHDPQHMRQVFVAQTLLGGTVALTCVHHPTHDTWSDTHDIQHT